MPKGPQLTLKVGDPAPEFIAPASGGATVSLKDLRGRPVIRCWEPKEGTPGCTQEACGFREAFEEFRKRGAVVLGVSPDSPKSHDKFTVKFTLPFALVSDTDHKIAEAYGVWGEKQFMGRKYQGVHRVTFLIGADGRLAAIWPEVKPETHAAQVLAAL